MVYKYTFLTLFNFRSPPCETSMINTYLMQFNNFYINFCLFLSGKHVSSSIFNITGSFPKCLKRINAFYSAEMWSLTDFLCLLLIKQVNKLLTSPTLECWVVMISPDYNIQSLSSFFSYCIVSLTW